jgi:hypothetical protein
VTVCAGGSYGGGSGGYTAGVTSRWATGGGGGASAYLNNFTVAAGSSYQVVVGAGSTSGYQPAGGGCVRIIWPGTRSFIVAGDVNTTNSNSDLLNANG